ncbi:O-antigen ligase family protein [Sanguibacter massiliensis]|uniref:O-antigen ligase family protein n=1 Tax=Sanguibacter massiliensis TaxID=1973217 RepID=UPI0013EA9760|nr:O-antigen ligase family protein [Sanguibacter massiliensis]
MTTLGAPPDFPDSTSGERPSDDSGDRGRHAASIMTIGLTGVVLWAVSGPRALWGNPIDTYLMIAAVALVGIIVVQRRPSQRLVVPLLPLAFGLSATVTLLWTGSRRATLTALLIYGSVAVLALAISAFVPRRHLVLSLAVGTVIIVTTSVAAIWLPEVTAFRPAGIGYTMTTFVGLYGHWNILSYVLCLTLPAILAVPVTSQRGWALKIIAAASTAAALCLTRSASGIVTSAVLVAAWIALMGIRRLVLRRAASSAWPTARRWLWTGIVVAVVGTAVAAVAVVVPRVLDKEVSNLSGRVPLWNAIAQVTSDRPWRGFGFGAVWEYHWLDAGDSKARALINSLIPYPLAHGHNGAIDLVVQVGIVGTLLYLCIILRATWRAGRMFLRDGDATAVWTLLTMLTLVFLGMTEPLWMVPLGWFLVVLAACLTDGARLPDPPHDRPRHARASVRSGKI